MTGLDIHQNALGFTCIRLHYRADPEKDPFNPDPHISERAKAWLEDQRKSWPDPNDWAREFEINFDVGQGVRVFPQFTSETHSRKLEYTPRKIIYRAWDFGYHCFPLDHEILTRGGWKKIGEVKRGEQILTLNQTTRRIEIQPAQETIRRAYAGPMYRWGPDAFGIEVTDAHTMLYQAKSGAIRSKKAKDLGPSVVSTPRALEQSGTSIGDARAAFLGLYLSEGSTRHDGKHYYTWIWQNAQDPWMQKWLNKTGHPWRYYSDKRGGRGWCVAGKELHKSLRGFGGSREKFVPDEVKNATPEEIRLFLEAYTRGDGTFTPARGRRKSRVVIYTASKRMADDLQELYARLGIAASIKGCQSKLSRWTQWRVSPRQSTPTLSKRALTVQEKTLEVACVTVENGSLFVRRGPEGTPIWCGNCPVCLIAQVDSRDRLLILKEIVGFQRILKDFSADVLAQCAQLYPNHAAGFADYCDPAGQQVKSIESEKSEKRDVEVLNGLGIFPEFEYGWSTKDGRTLIHSLLALRYDKTPGIYVDPTGCPKLTQAFLGQYVYPERKSDNKVSEDPNDDEHPWSDVMASLRYLVTGLHQKLGLRRHMPNPMPQQAHVDYQGYGTKRRER